MMAANALERTLTKSESFIKTQNKIGIVPVYSGIFRGINLTEYSKTLIRSLWHRVKNAKISGGESEKIVSMSRLKNGGTKKKKN